MALESYIPGFDTLKRIGLALAHGSFCLALELLWLVIVSITELSALVWYIYQLLTSASLHSVCMYIAELQLFCDPDGLPHGQKC